MGRRISSAANLSVGQTPIAGDSVVVARSDERGRMDTEGSHIGNGSRIEGAARIHYSTQRRRQSAHVLLRHQRLAEIVEKRRRGIEIRSDSHVSKIEIVVSMVEFQSSGFDAKYLSVARTKRDHRHRAESKDTAFWFGRLSKVRFFNFNFHLSRLSLGTEGLIIEESRGRTYGG